MNKQKQNSKGGQDTIMEVASVVINNQATAEENAVSRTNDTNSRLERTLSYRQFCYALTLMFVVLFFTMSLGGKLIRGDYWFTKGKEQQLLVENAKLKEEVAQHSWLWNSHFLFLSVALDDPSYMNKNDSMPWTFFLEHANTARFKGFVDIVEDGRHPNMIEWLEAEETVEKVKRTCHLRVLGSSSQNSFASEGVTTLR